MLYTIFQAKQQQPPTKQSSSVDARTPPEATQQPEEKPETPQKTWLGGWTSWMPSWKQQAAERPPGVSRTQSPTPSIGSDDEAEDDFIDQHGVFVCIATLNIEINLSYKFYFSIFNAILKY